MLYKYTTKNFGTFKAMGIKGPTPLPLLGNVHQILWNGVIKCDQEWIKKYGKVFVTFARGKPILVVADVDMLRQIQVSSCYN